MQISLFFAFRVLESFNPNFKECDPNISIEAIPVEIDRF